MEGKGGLDSDGNTCSWCNHIYRTPKLLACGHPLCEKCIEELLCFSILQSFEICTSKVPVDAYADDSEHIGRKHNTIHEVACPVCKKPTAVHDYATLVDSLQENEQLAEICSRLIAIQESKNCGWCEKVPGVQECDKCEVLFCAECREETHKRAAFDTHQFYDLGELEKQKAKTCSKHKGRRKDLFCRDCGESLCLYCTKFETLHKDHSLCSFPEANQDLHKDIQQMMTRYDYVARDFAQFHTNVATTAKALKEV